MKTEPKTKLRKGPKGHDPTDQPYLRIRDR